MSTIEMVTTPDGPMPCAIGVPDVGGELACMVIHESFGLTDYVVSVVRDLAALGIYAIAPALMHRLGSPVFAYDDLSQVRDAMSQLTRDSIDLDLDCALDRLSGAGFDRPSVSALGFCSGGYIAFHAARRHALGSAVTFYGGPVVSSRFGYPSVVAGVRDLETPWLGIYGGSDVTITHQELDELSQAVKSAPVESRLVLFEQGQHGFHCWDRQDVYDPAAATESWEHALQWIQAHARRGKR
jgi:carboxymethylenebutenolidase